MKTLDWLRLLIALLLAGTTSYGLLTLGFGAAGAWIVAALLTTVFFSTAGGLHRVTFAAVAVIPPFLINRTWELSADWQLYRNTRSPAQAFQDMFLVSAEETSIAFGMFVALPLLIVWAVSRISKRKRHPDDFTT